MDDNPSLTSTDAPVEPTGSTQIPVTTPDEAPAEPVADASEAQPSVPGSQDITPAAENLNVGVPEPLPNPVPATAEPATDAVTVNANWEKVTYDLNQVVSFVENVLKAHPLFEEVVGDIKSVVDKVSSRA